MFLKIFKIQASQDGNLAKADPAFTETPPGFGPRHMAIHADQALAFVVFELESYVGVYQIDEATGALSQKFLVDLMPEPSPADFAAEIEISPSGKHLYVSNRANGAIVVYEILPDGNLDRVQVQFLGGSTPRHFRVHPSGAFLIVALQDASKIELYSIDSESGLLYGEAKSIDCPNSPTIVGLLDL